MATQDVPLFGMEPAGSWDLEALQRPTRGLWGDAWHRLTRNRLALAALGGLIAIVLLAYGGAFVGPTGRYGPDERDYSAAAKEADPSMAHWFGTDRLGRDTFARVLEGVRISLQIGFGTQVVVLIIGLAIGAAAALGGKWSDNLLMRFTDVMYAFPSLLAIILVRSVLVERELGLLTNPRVMIIIAIAFVSWTTIARLVRGQMLSLRERDYVLAARALGAGNVRVVVHHMLPNTLGPVIVAITFGIPYAIFAEASLGFIGLGVPPPTASLGTLVAAGYAVIERHVWGVVFPAGGVAVLMLCFTFLGDGLRDALDPRTR
jgi:oligopeptide transport system permease protein